MSEQLIYESSNSQVYLLNESKWGVPVIRKTLNNEYPLPAEIARFYNEFEVLSGLDIQGARQVLEKSRYKKRPALYLEYIPAQTLSDVFQSKQNDIVDFLYLAIAIAKAVATVHQHGIIHKDISANNILVDLQNRTAKIIDFGISTMFDVKTPHLGNPERLEGNLGYISPEQTGRMNRLVDYRSDLYSMGVVFFEMLTGHLPFKARDAIEHVHAHIAQTPARVDEINPRIPTIIAQIIGRLLAKNAEDRYQSAMGVAHDLGRCLEEYESNRMCTTFTLGENDYSGKFRIPQKLFGRENEVAILLKTFDQASEGALKMMLVAGYSGTGKSALVHEIHKPIAKKRGHFIEGKFDQFQRGVPYFAILQAFEEYVDLLLTENKERLANLQLLIQEAVGREGGVLTDVIPKLEHIIGKQPELEAVGGSETQNRFNYVFCKFVAAISTREHPIVLFIDDLQWADAASLNLLKVLVIDKGNKHCLCIGAYRDNEVNDAHPFMIFTREVRELGADISAIHIGNLSLEDVNSMIAESVSASVKQTRELTGLVYEKTNGNAFFVIQFLKLLYEDKLLRFDHEQRRWLWDVQKTRERNITDNVVELMSDKIKKLPTLTKKVMKSASCIGNSFDLSTLSVINEKPSEQILENLHESLAEGLITPLGEHYRFAHDRIQQAVYSLIPELERSRVHLSIGKLMLENLPVEKQEEQLFDIVNHWNKGTENLTDNADKDLLAKLNLRAGIKAKQASAFKPAFAYLVTGIGLLPDKHWQSRYELSLELHTLAAETAYLNGDFLLMEEYINAVLENARELLEKVVPYEIRILAYKAQNRLLDAINTGTEVLGQLGESFPKKPNTGHVMFTLAKTKLMLTGKNVEYLANLPEMTNPEKIASMRIIAGIASSSYWATPALFPLLIFRMCHLSLRHGNTALSAFGFATYGVIMCGVLGAMKSGYQYGKLGLILLDRFNARAWLTQIYTPIYALINNWNEHVKNTLQPLQESYHIGLESGAIEFACINANIYCIHAYLTGRPLEKIEAEAHAYSDSFNQYNQETNFNYNEVYRQAMLNFMGKSENPLALTGSAYNESSMMKQNLERNDKTGRFFIHFNKLILCCYFNDYPKAQEHAEASRELLEAVLAKFEIPNHHFYEALALLALYPNTDNIKKKKMMKRVSANLHQLKKWAKDAPQNFKHKYQLIEAERLSVLGQKNMARIQYDLAIEGAADNGYIQEEALAYELAGRFYLEGGSEGLAEFYLKAAYNSYREWGAEAKLRDLEQHYPEYVSGALGRRRGLDTTTSLLGVSSMGDRTMLDLITVFKASTAISGEIKLKNLLQILMKLVIENAGAENGSLLLVSEGRLLIQARQDINGGEAEVLQSQRAGRSELIAGSVVEFVRRARESVVVHDALNDKRFSRDPYIIRRQPKSILSVPIINQGKFLGVLYLENNLTTGAFTQNRIDLLMLLSGQIAVSIDNAMLYENLEQLVRERTNELAKEKEKADQLLLNILPLETADELKQRGKAVPRRYDNVTVMFTDFKDFTRISSQLSAEELVDEIDTCFAAFDEIMGQFGIEKIKTIGDAYMCAGGLPVANSTHAADAVNAALAVQAWMAKRRQERRDLGKPEFDIRIGLHSGPVVSGVVGTRKFAYDIWGETVNIAARMESSSEPGKINISGTTYEQIKHHFECTYRGKVPAKNMDNLDMYFVSTKK